MIEVKNLSKSFDTIKAIDYISAHIEEVHVFGLIGTNGAGKSASAIRIPSSFRSNGSFTFFNIHPPHKFS